MPLDASIDTAANAVRAADALLVCAGAGIGVDSGLPDFRGSEGFWRAYPPLKEAGLCFEDIASPETFRRDPTLAWGFYGHRLNLYRATVPHTGFAILQAWARSKPHGAFVFTSNVDGQFQKAGFDAARIVECHGSLHHLQCLYNCSSDIWSADDDTPVVDETTCRAAHGTLPLCPRCRNIARPNLWMFDDWYWREASMTAQAKRLDTWLGEVTHTNANLAVIEIGAGCDIPTVRDFAENVAHVAGATLIRINPHDFRVPGRGDCIPIPLGALDALTQIDTLLTQQ